MLDAITGLFSSSVSDEVAVRNFLGMFRKRRRTALVRLNKTPHVSVFGPTGSGKNRCLITPFLMTCPDPCVIIDIKGGESAKLTAEHRWRRFGHKPYFLDPMRQVTQSPHTLNPLEFIDKDCSFALNDADEIGHAIVEHKQEQGDGLHFLHKAEEVISTAIAAAVWFGEGPGKSLPSVCNVLSCPESWEEAVDCMLKERGAWEGMLSRRAGNLGHLKDREQASTMSTVSRFLHFLLSPDIAESTRSSSFHPDEVCDGKADVYLILEPHRVETLTPLLRLWIGCLLRNVFRRGLQERNLIHFICDEAYSLGEFQPLAAALTVGRGYGIRMNLFYQDLAELQKCWKDGAHRTLLANTSQVYLRINDLDTAKTVSESIGKQTIMVQDFSTNKGWSATYAGNPENSSCGRSGGESESRKPHGRNLSDPDEIMRLDARMAISLVPGLPPICLPLLRYDEESFEEKPENEEKRGVLTKAIVILILAVAVAVWITLVRFPIKQEPFSDTSWIREGEIHEGQRTNHP